MKAIIGVSLLMLLCINLNAVEELTVEQSEQAHYKQAQLTIEILNIEDLEGDIRIGVFNRSENFLKQGFTYKNYIVKVQDSTETIIINDLPPGEYAFILYHDKNADTKMNRNFLGIPKEPFGFSNNLKPKFSKPTFEECKFLLEKDLVLQIPLIFYN
ncbi:MAG: DUF2141 domain-containing protein [Candidatus Neomarinimicrobiota bacterium]|jgi:uncharacterized protein (DUF2141 family)